VEGAAAGVKFHLLEAVPFVPRDVRRLLVVSGKRRELLVGPLDCPKTQENVVGLCARHIDENAGTDSAAIASVMGHFR